MSPKKAKEGKRAGASVGGDPEPDLPSLLTNLDLDAPSPPPLPLDGYSLDPRTCPFVCSEPQQRQFESLAVTLAQAREIEKATRDQSNSQKWHRERRLRLTSSKFREACFVRGPTTAENLAERMKTGAPQTPLMKRGLEQEPVALKRYSEEKKVRYWPCGFVIHPDAPWLGASPDGVVFDPTGSPRFGLVEIKCPDKNSYAECDYLQQQNSTFSLKQSHKYYWQVQGQLLITGMDWCDFVVFAKDDMFVERIRRDANVARDIRERGDYFFFYFYLG